MENYINESVEYNWTKEDVITEYQALMDKKRVARIFCITVKQVNEILKSKGCDSQ